MIKGITARPVYVMKANIHIRILRSEVPDLMCILSFCRSNDHFIVQKAGCE